MRSAIDQKSRTALCSFFQNIVAGFYRFSVRDIRAPAQFGGFAISCSPVTISGDKPHKKEFGDGMTNTGFFFESRRRKSGFPVVGRERLETALLSDSPNSARLQSVKRGENWDCDRNVAVLQRSLLSRKKERTVPNRTVLWWLGH